MFHFKSQGLLLPINQPKDKFGAADTGSGKFGILLFLYLIEEKAIHFIFNQPSQLVFIQFFLKLLFCIYCIVESEQIYYNNFSYFNHYTELPHTQGTQGNSGNFQVDENLRKFGLIF